ncbi:hypothetical protein ACFOWE_00605 [Planomonospora corallina]|uniref:Uncharacterized protein n=1 Tax=Planomonospora corallina TaxID=1806052 RepID=A0ABV8I139_9ACTN
MEGDQLVPGRGVGTGLQTGHDLQVCGIGEEMAGHGGGELGDTAPYAAIRRVLLSWSEEVMGMVVCSLESVMSGPASCRCAELSP